MPRTPPRRRLAGRTGCRGLPATGSRAKPGLCDFCAASRGIPPHPAGLVMKINALYVGIYVNAAFVLRAGG